MSVFTCAVPKVVDQKNEQERRTYDLVHDGGLFCLFTPNESSEEEQLFYIPAQRVYVHVCVHGLIMQISPGMSEEGGNLSTVHEFILKMR